MSSDTSSTTPAGHSHGALVAMVEGLEAQLHSIYEERSASSYLSVESSMESLQAQLNDLYAEREEN